jgi:hypothetical protein
MHGFLNKKPSKCISYHAGGDKRKSRASRCPWLAGSSVSIGLYLDSLLNPPDEIYSKIQKNAKRY